MPLSDQPTYPNEFFTLLGIQDTERVVVPAFSSPDLIEEWCGNEMSYRALEGQRVFELMPEDWWISFNPGSELGKDLSPWEIDQLRGGEQNIDAVVAENLVDDDIEALKVDPLEEDELPELRTALSEAAKSVSDVEALYLLKETALTQEGDNIETVLLGIEIYENSSSETSEVEQTLRPVAEQGLIGYGRLRVLCGKKGQDGFTLGIFKNIEPFYRGSTPPTPEKSQKKGLWGLFSK
jgi:hypothetical protein